MSVLLQWQINADDDVIVWGAGATKTLVVADALHSHVADNVVWAGTLLQAHWSAYPSRKIFLWPLISGPQLAAEHASHAHDADNVVLSVEDFVVADASHDHAADAILLGVVTEDLPVNDAVHQHTAEQFSLAVVGGAVVYIPATFDEFISAPSMARCWLLELEAFPLSVAAESADVSAGYADATYSELSYAEGSGVLSTALQTLTYSDQGYISRIFTAGMAGGDPDSRVWYDGRMNRDIRIERRIVGRDGIGGLSRVFADVSLVNLDGGLDTVTRDYSLPGRAARLYLGHPYWKRSRFELVASGVSTRIWTTLTDQRVSLSDGLARLDRSVNINTYLGTGTGATVEGGTDLKGKAKPKAWGKVFNATPPFVDGALLIYQVNDGACQDVPTVYDRGVSLTKGANYSSLADMTANAPSAGQYRVWPAGGMFRLGSTPAGTITADIDAGEAGGGGGSGIVAVREASQDVLFANQSNYTMQVINTFTAAANIPEAGIHGTLLSNGETLRFGKRVDPVDSQRQALFFQVHKNDPETSSGQRAEISFSPNILMNQTYWLTFDVLIGNWGTLSSSDNALFGTQLHAGQNVGGAGPVFGIYTKQTGSHFQVQARYSESATPGPGNTISTNYTEYAIPFGTWMKFVFKFKTNTSGNGLLQVWKDDVQIVDRQGVSLGYNVATPDYVKCGYYNWTQANMNTEPRKVYMRSPRVIVDNGYTYEQITSTATLPPSTTGEIVYQLLTEQAEIDPGDIDVSSFDALDAVAPAAVGMWVGTEGEKIDTVVDSLLNGVGAFGGFSRLGKFTVGLVAAPDIADSVATFTEEEIFDIERLPLPQSIEPIAWRARVGWQRNYTLQNDFASSVGAARRAFAAESVRLEKHEDSSIQSRHKLARELEAEGHFREQADATSEATRLKALWGVERSMFRVTVPMRGIDIDLGQVVTFTHRRFGWSSGVAARVIGHALMATEVELTVLV